MSTVMYMTAIGVNRYYRSKHLLPNKKPSPTTTSNFVTRSHIRNLDQFEIQFIGEKKI